MPRFALCWRQIVSSMPVTICLAPAIIEWQGSTARMMHLASGVPHVVTASTQPSYGHAVGSASRYASG